MEGERCGGREGGEEEGGAALRHEAEVLVLY